MQHRCVNMIARLFHASVGDNETAVGTGTVGSSEALMLAGLAFKRKWQQKRKLQGKPFDKPNIVAGANVQVFSSICFYLFCSYPSCIFIIVYSLHTFRVMITDIIPFYEHLTPSLYPILWDSSANSCFFFLRNFFGNGTSKIRIKNS